MAISFPLLFAIYGSMISSTGFDPRSFVDKYKLLLAKDKEMGHTQILNCNDGNSRIVQVNV